MGDLRSEEKLSFFQQLAESRGSSGGQLAVEETICTHICDTHILIGYMYLQATERLWLGNTGRVDDREDHIIKADQLLVLMPTE